MAISFYNGAPPDSYGSDGDGVIDYKNHLIWGPKGNVTAGSWQNTAANNAGPTGPAQLSGNGAPSNTLGQNGNGYCDLSVGNTYYKSNNAWAQVGNILGPAGTPGANVLGSTGAAFGAVSYLSGAALSSTPVTMNFPGTNVANVFQPMVGSAFLGCSVQGTQGGTASFSLYNLTTSQTVYTLSCPTNSSTAPYATSGTSLFPVTQYPLATGNQYVWQMASSKSETAGGVVFPTYATPSGSTAQAMSTLPLLGWPTSQTMSANNQYTLPVFGGTAPPSYYYPVRTGGLYAVVATLTATGSTSTSATAKLLAYYQDRNGLNSVSAASYNKASITANGQPQILFGPSSDTTALSNSYRFLWQLQPDVNMTCTMQLQIYSYA